MASGSASPMRAILFAFCANLGIAFAKSGAAAYTGSSAMLAEAIHSFADAANQLLLLLGMRQARRPPDREHPLGYGKLSYFWSFVVALLLFSAGGLFSIYEGWHKLGHPEPIEQVWIAIGVLVLAIGLEGISMRACMQEVNALRGDRSLWRWLNASRSSELVVVFGEDLAALLGLIVALGFVGAASLTGDPRYDAYGSLAIGSLLVVIAVFLAIRIKALLIGRSADPRIVSALTEQMGRDPAILEVFNVITVQVGSQFMLAAKVRLEAELPLGEAVRHINQLEARLKEQVPTLAWSFIEPDLAD